MSARTKFLSQLRKNATGRKLRSKTKLEGASLPISELPSSSPCQEQSLSSPDAEVFKQFSELLDSGVRPCTGACALSSDNSESTSNSSLNTCGGENALLSDNHVKELSAISSESESTPNNTSLVTGHGEDAPNKSDGQSVRLEKSSRQDSVSLSDNHENEPTAVSSQSESTPNSSSVTGGYNAENECDGQSVSPGKGSKQDRILESDNHLREPNSISLVSESTPSCSSSWLTEAGHQGPLNSSNVKTALISGIPYDAIKEKTTEKADCLSGFDEGAELGFTTSTPEDGLHNSFSIPLFGPISESISDFVPENKTDAKCTEASMSQLRTEQGKTSNHALCPKRSRRKLFEDEEYEPISESLDEFTDCVTPLLMETFDLESYSLSSFNPLDNMLLASNEDSEMISDENLRSSCVNVSAAGETVSGDSGIENGSSGPEKPKRTREYTPPEKPSRKRKRNPTAWKSVVAKDLLNKGKEHLNQKGKLIKARSMKPECDSSCRMHCSTNLSNTDREEIFKGFWAIGSHQGKWDFIANNVERVEIKRRTSSCDSSKRKHSRKYSFTLKGKKTFICKTMFTSTLDICDGWITTSIKKQDKNAIGEISPDKRGKNKPKPNEAYEKKKQRVKEHIEGLPRMPSHYVRAASSKDYLIEDIRSVSEMHNLYSTWMDENHCGEPKATYRLYNDIFNFEYNISFFIAKKDQCDICVGYENAEGGDKESLKEDYDFHLLMADVAQTMRMADTKVAQLRSSKTLCVANFDYQKTLICPKGKASVFYYKRKLSVSNFTIVDSGRHHDVAYCYDETIAAKGSNEVASFVYHFIEEKVKDGVTDFRFYSDNCTGQNKNRGVVAMYLHAAAKFKIIITHKFLEKGHTWNAADNVHSVIETRIGKRNVYSPEEYYDHIANAKRKADPIQVIRVNQDMVYDWKGDLALKLNLDKDITGKHIPWTKLREISVNGVRDHELSFKVSHSGDAVVVSTKGVGRPVNLEKYEPQKVYQRLLPISKAKYRDLVYYCDNNLIPTNLHTYFKSLPHSNIDQEENERAEAEILEVDRGRARKRRAPVKNQKRQKRHTMEDDDPDDDL